MIGAIELRRMAGLYTAKEAAEELGMNRWTFYGQLRAGRWPRPTTRIVRGRRCYYTAKRSERIERENEKTRVAWCCSGSIIVFTIAAETAIIQGHST